MDTEVIEAVSYVMEFVDGLVLDDPTREVTLFLVDAVLDRVSRASELINEAASW
ncbi:MAG: hypothetical protein HN979_02900 [Actinobacteria bacterium]|jgi:hypothetical protein|nr:hypothetical protein [Actinomycetota bacterium]MBT3688383.1 hypothetical protein [Actinomycetota bacterium]MBT4037281.1 hypothetical protein [Actinomycetota bacterium]MBT4278719.1 hypothetical protein [Actinomycetota bacterium]MBT4343953.1 hypothetical protein [Actinomycetota bacterium]